MKKIVLAITGLLFGILLQAQGIYELWGMTAWGGTEDAGSIFKTDGRANNFQPIHSFSAATGTRSPYGRLALHNGKLYGMMTSATPPGPGVIFEVDPVTGAYTEKLTRNNDINGGPGTGTLISYGNKLYGIGLTDNGGIIFEWDPVTNIFTKKIDLFTMFGVYQSFQQLILVGNKFYGSTANGGTNSYPTIFDWDPATNVYTTRFDIGTLLPANGNGLLGWGLEEKDGKLYGTIMGAGANQYGEIFEWDTATNIYTKKIDFNINSSGGTPGIEGASPIAGLTRLGDKYYGTALDGGYWGMGVLYEWDPLVNLPSPYDPDLGAYVVEHDFDAFFIPDNTGRNPDSKLTAFRGRLYGIVTFGGLNEKGVLFEYDPVTKIFTKKHDFDAINTIAPGIGTSENGVIPVPASIAIGTPGVCNGFSSVTIDNSNNNDWVPITDNLGRAIAEIKANGNNLGLVTTELYVHNATPREDASQTLYLDRNLTITPQVQPATPVDIRLYIRNTELETLKNTVNSIGQPSGVNSINDLSIFKNDDACGSLTAGAVPVVTTAESWTGGYVLSASINSFSSFYFANKANTTLPLNFISFTGQLVNNDGVLTWKTDNEINTSHFEIERSFDGRSYFAIGKVNSVNSAGVHQYTFTDANINPGASAFIYYRLKSSDIDGRFTYSPVVVLNMKNNPVVLLYPNPATNKANLTVSVDSPQQLQLRIIDNMGRVVKLQQLSTAAGSISLQIDIKNLSKGLYYLELRGATFNKRLNFLKQ